MQHKRIEVFSAGCSVCQDAIATIRKIAEGNHHITVWDIYRTSVAKRAKALGIDTVPAVLVDGKLISRTDEATLKALLDD